MIWITHPIEEIKLFFEQKNSLRKIKMLIKNSRLVRNKNHRMIYDDVIEYLKYHFFDYYFKNWYRWKCTDVEIFLFKENEHIN